MTGTVAIKTHIVTTWMKSVPLCPYMGRGEATHYTVEVV